MSRAARLRAWGAAVLAIGLAAAALIVAFAPEDRDAALADAIAGARMYRHNLQLMGGSMGVMIAEFDRWFAGLWHGRALAGTVAVLAVCAALACFVAAHFAGDADRNRR